jgi:hypothetical protein
MELIKNQNSWMKFTKLKAKSYNLAEDNIDKKLQT